MKPRMLRVLRPALPFAAMVLSRCVLNCSFVPMDSSAGLSSHAHEFRIKQIVASKERNVPVQSRHQQTTGKQTM